ncbi:hypothetical protein ACB092_06G112100 [Castanea dentata]
MLHPQSRSHGQNEPCRQMGFSSCPFPQRAFAPLNGGIASELPDSNSWKQPFDARRYFTHSESD